ncbi:MAG: DUF5060 domain-containing protein [Rhodothermales bacterium]|nr:DUF5060 domain-containing protein [Rhodothermales bacterium]
MASLFFVLLFIVSGCQAQPSAGVEAQRSTGTVAITGELKAWHRVTLSFDGPAASETGPPNPFMDYRMDVTFQHGDTRFVVPGFYAGDGDAAETGAEAGGVWRAHFAPDMVGTWTYAVSFRVGPGVAVADDPAVGQPGAFDGQTGSFEVGPSDKTGRDFRGKGRLEYAGERYFRFAGNGEYFLKGGTDSPENLLAYADFDNTTAGKAILHRYTPHVADWREGDPTWRGEKGKGLIGALNYLASEGLNSVYFLTMNVEGDGDDVFPYTSKSERTRFDVSKLEQWEIVFSHMDSLGLMLHVVTQETENDQLLDGGELGPERRLYYRESIARFAHHPALVWNLGEENTNTDAQRKAFAGYLRALDPYDHPIVIHTFPGEYDAVYAPLLGFDGIDGPSLQMGDMTRTYAETQQWIARSAEAGRPWVVSLDEIGPHTDGVTPDGPGNNHDAVRRHALWGNLMAGGAGVEWYFGYEHPHTDLNLEDFRSRDAFWDYTRHALAFFREHLPFDRMVPKNDLLEPGTDAWVLAVAGEVYAVYAPAGGSVRIDLNDKDGMVRVRWFNPRTGEFAPAVARLVGRGDPAQPFGQYRTLKAPDTEGDWVALLQ